MRGASNQFKWVLLAAVALALALGVERPNAAQANVTASIEVWSLPTASSLPADIDFDPVDGFVYVAEFSAGRIARVDPFTDEITEWSVLDGPNALRVVRGSGNSLVLEPPAVYYTAAQANAVSRLDPLGGTVSADFALTPGSFPNGLALDLRGATPQVWYSGRQTNTLGRFDAGASRAAIGTFPAATRVQPRAIAGSVTTTFVTPAVTRGNPALPPAAALVPPTAAGPYAEWDLNALGFTPGAYPEGLAVDGAGGVWLASGPHTLLYFDQTVFYAYGLPPGAAAYQLDLDAAGNVWFTQGYSQKIGMLVPLTGDVFEWTLPRGGQPFDIAVDPVSHNVWFTEREGQRIGMLNPSTNELLEVDVPGFDNPLYLALDDVGGVWFSAERGNYVARLNLSALGDPPSG